MKHLRRLALLTIAAGLPLSAAVRLPSLIADHMVLQSGSPARIWGKADSGESVNVGFRGRTVFTKAGADGRWQVFLPPLEPGGPFNLTVNQTTIGDVLVGEVWVASGQSNMQFAMDRVDNAEREIAAAKYPRIRRFMVTRQITEAPQEDVKGSWELISPEIAKKMSAVAYFFAQNVYEARKTPVGIIQSAVGGSPAQAWTPAAKLKADPLLSFYLTDWDQVMVGYPEARKAYEADNKKWQAASAEARRNKRAAPRPPQVPPGPDHQWAPSRLYNGMIAPIHPYTIRGVIWYQGENNGSRGQGSSYNRLFETMIRSWRDLWGQGDFPFLFVQLPNLGKPDTEKWSELREAQLQTLALRNTGMAVTLDLGNPADVHPTHKRPVGERLALVARALVYGEKIEYSGPVFRQAATEGSALRLWFDHSDGLKAKGGDLRGFELAGEDGKFVPASARIDGSAIVVECSTVGEPRLFRYAWGDDPPFSVYNKAGLPASPFRGSVE